MKVIALLLIIISSIGCAYAAYGIEAPKLDPLDKATLEALFARRDLAQSRLDNLILQFVNSNPDARRYREQTLDLSSEVNTKLADVYKKLNVDPAKYSFNQDTLTFVER